MRNAILFHDGCNICLSVEDNISGIIDKSKFKFESVNLGINNEKGKEAKQMGIKRLPSLVVDGVVMKIDDHSSIDDYIGKEL